MFGSTDLISDAVKELSDISSQKRMWVVQTGDEVSSFSECVSALYDDTGLLTELQEKRLVFNTEIDEALRRLKDTLDRVDQTLRPAELVASVEMERVRSEALTIKKMLDQALGKQKE
jgi:hypothetical protein